MTAFKGNKASAPQLMRGDGGAIFLDDKITLTANITAADTIDFRIPAGMRVDDVSIGGDRIDTNGAPTLVFSAGYTPVDTTSALAPSLAYFLPAGQTALSVAVPARARASFKPITFEEDVWLRLSLPAVAATFVAGDVYAVIGGVMNGPK